MLRLTHSVVPMHVAEELNHKKTRQPHFSEVGLVAFVPEVWGGPWLSRHQVLTRLSEYFHVVWAEPAKSWRELLRSRQAPTSRSQGSELFPEGLSFYQPERWLPQ